MRTRSGGSERFVGRALPAASGQARPTWYNIGKNTEKRRAIFGLTEPGLSPNRAQFCHCEILREGVESKDFTAKLAEITKVYRVSNAGPSPWGTMLRYLPRLFPRCDFEYEGFL